MLGLAAGTVSCGAIEEAINGTDSADEKKKNDSGGSPKGFLTSSDLAEDNAAETVSEYDIRNLISTSSYFYNEYPEPAATEESEEEKTCTSSIDSAKAEATKTSLKIEVTDNQYKCGVLNESAKKSTFRLLMAFGCSSGDFSAWNGKTMAEIEAEQAGVSSNFPCESGTGYTIYNLKMDFVGEFDVGGGGVLTSVDSKAISGQMTASGEACAFSIKDKVMSFSNGCMVFDNSLTVIDGAKTASRTMLEYHDITAEKGEKFYTSGVIKGTMAGWTGTVTFNKAAGVPTYSFSNGETTVTGEIESDPHKEPATTEIE